MKRTPSTFKLWLAGCFVSVVLVGLVYGAVQQSERQSANDPQIQLAEDTAAALNAGATPGTLVAAQAIDLNQSLAPFIIILDANHRVLASSVRLNGATPIPPAGVLIATSSGHGKGSSNPHEDRLTWQPTGSVREAAVVTTWHGGYVVAGRSLREVEARESTLMFISAVALAVLVAGLSLIFWLA